jgi:exoribonuclease R
MLGTLKFSSRVQYGRNKRNIPYYLYEPDKPNEKNIIVSSKQGRNTRIDHYCKIDIIDETSNPIKGALLRIIGPVNEYQATKEYILEKNFISKKSNIEFSYTQNNKECNFQDFTYSIDPKGSKDIDDAFSYDFENKILSIHITDLSELEISNFDNLVERAFTFYDNDFNINLLPEEISENNFSLLEDQVRNVITMNINLIDSSYTFFKNKIKVFKNLSYEDADIFLNESEKWRIMKNDLSTYFGEINDSHNLVEKMMIEYNSKFSSLLEKTTDSYPIRVHSGIKQEILDDLIKSNIIDENLKNKICFYAAEYVNNKFSDDKFHKHLNIEKYTHATSPLRRIIDIINQKIAFNNFSLDINHLCEIVNERNKAFKKAYNDIKLLNLINQENDDKIFDGIIIGLDDFKIKVYIIELDIIKYIDLFYGKLQKIFLIQNQDGNSIKVLHRTTKECITLQMYQKIKLLSIVKKFESRLHKKLKFFIKEPNLINLLD